MAAAKSAVDTLDIDEGPPKTIEQPKVDIAPVPKETEPPKVDPEPPKVDPPKVDPEPPKVDPEPPKADPLADLDFVPRVDHDKPPVPPAPKEETPAERESLAQQRAAENGRKLKELETAHNELKLERDRYKEQAERAIVEVDPFSVPEVRDIRSTIQQSVTTVIEGMENVKAGQMLGGNVNGYMEMYLEASSESDHSKATVLREKLREKARKDFEQIYLADNPEGSDTYDERDMASGAKEYVREVLGVLTANADRTQKLIKAIGDVKERAREGSLSKGVEEYQAGEKEIIEAVGQSAELPDEFISQHPDKPESLVASLVKNKDWKDRYNEISNELVYMFHGPRALTPDDMSRLKANQVDIPKFMKARQQKWAAARKEFFVKAAQALALRPLIEQMSKDSREFKRMQQELASVTGGNPAPLGNPAPPAERQRGERRSWVDEALEGA